MFLCNHVSYYVSASLSLPILLSFCLCAFLCFAPGFGHVSIFVDISHSKPCVTGSVCTALCFCKCMDFYVCLGLYLCAFMQTCVGMTISVHVFAVLCISASLCIFFFVQSVIVSTGLSAYFSMHRLTLVQVSLTTYPCILLFWALIIFVFFRFLYASFRI